VTSRARTSGTGKHEEGAFEQDFRSIRGLCKITTIVNLKEIVAGKRVRLEQEEKNRTSVELIERQTNREIARQERQKEGGSKQSCLSMD
jgi:hypothetical protein